MSSPLLGEPFHFPEIPLDVTFCETATLLALPLTGVNYWEGKYYMCIHLVNFITVRSFFNYVLIRSTPEPHLGRLGVIGIIGLVKHHNSLVVSERSNFQLPVLETSHQIEAGCRILINMILLRVASAMSMDETDMNIIPEFSVAKTTFPNNLSFGSVVNLLTKLPSR